ncbi:MAG: FxsA family protein [Spirochaetales bacterium]|nr:FxsA family protein [Spirochaetales bacterium]
MNQARVLLRFFDRSFITRLLLLALLYSLLPLAEIFLLIYLGAKVGNYFTLALAAVTGLIGMLFALRGFHKYLDILKKKIRAGQYPGEEFATLTGILLAAILLLTPGFITDVLGLLLFVPAIRSGLGRLMIRLTRTDLKELYEYLKLYD